MKKKPEKTAEEEVSVEYLSDLSGWTTRRIQQLVDDDAIPKIGHGKYPKERALKAMFAHFQAQTSNVTARTKEHAERQAKADADKAEVEAALKIGSVVFAGEIEAQWEDVGTQIRVIVETFPGLTDGQRDGLIERMKAVKLSEAEA